MKHPKKRSFKNNKFSSRFSMIFIFLLYLSGTVLMLKGGYDFFVYPKL
ncbi:hypothetical protein L6303_04690 [archaeon]|nr:hypothetical protein [Nanoarchaeota archaeon]MCG2724016.1 hypothetical protein [archaeon]